jgi:hypothetical protein
MLLLSWGLKRGLCFFQMTAKVMIQAERKIKACNGKAYKDKSFKANACKDTACKGMAS